VLSIWQPIILIPNTSIEMMWNCKTANDGFMDATELFYSYDGFMDATELFYPYVQQQLQIDHNELEKYKD